MIKKIFILVFVLLFLTSCGDDESIVSGLTPIENPHFYFSIPSNWKILSSTGDTLPQIAVGDIELAITSENFVSGFANTLTILSTDLEKQISSKDYSMLENVGATKDYLGYTEISSKEITFADGTPSIIYEFEAQYNIETPKFKYLQVGHICEYKKYLITLALPTNTNDVSKYISLLSTFGCK